MEREIQEKFWVTRTYQILEIILLINSKFSEIGSRPFSSKEMKLNLENE